MSNVKYYRLTHSIPHTNMSQEVIGYFEVGSIVKAVENGSHWITVYASDGMVETVSHIEGHKLTLAQAMKEIEIYPGKGGTDHIRMILENNAVTNAALIKIMRSELSLESMIEKTTKYIEGNAVADISRSGNRSQANELLRHLSKLREYNNTRCSHVFHEAKRAYYMFVCAMYLTKVNEENDEKIKQLS